MGECGCGNMEIILDVFTIGGKVMVIEGYTGCNYCHEGLAIYLHLFTPEEAAEFDLIPTGGFEPDRIGIAQKGFAIVDQTDLVQAVEEMPGIEGYANLRGWLEDNGRDLLKRAAYNRLKAGNGD